MSILILQLIVLPLLVAVAYTMLLAGLDELVSVLREHGVGRKIALLIEVGAVVLMAVGTIARMTLAYTVVRQRIHHLGRR